MAWQKQENNEWISWADAKIGKRVEGFYRGSDTSQFGSTFYIIEDKKGKKFNVPGSGLLNWKLEQADYPRGAYIAIEFRGKERLKAGQFKGKEANKFDVFFGISPVYHNFSFITSRKATHITSVYSDLKFSIIDFIPN